MVHRCERSCASGSVALEVCDKATQCCHRTALRISGSSVDYGFSLDTIFLCGEQEADEVGTDSHDRSCGGRGCVEGLLSYEELEVSEEENWWLVSKMPL